MLVPQCPGLKNNPAKHHGQTLLPINKNLNQVKELVNRFPDFSTIALDNLNLNIRKVLNGSKIENEHLFRTHNLRSTFVSYLSILGLSETVISYVTHPSKKSNTSSVHIYDRRNMLDKAIIFAEEVHRIHKSKKSKLYSFESGLTGN